METTAASMENGEGKKKNKIEQRVYFVSSVSVVRPIYLHY